MYNDQYGLSGRPFQLTPDPRFWFESATHRKAMAYLGYGLDQGEGFIVITGEIGAGKTTLVGHLLAKIDPARIKTATIVSTHVDHEHMLKLVCRSFGLNTADADKTHLLAEIEAMLHTNARGGLGTLLIVDEAQNLSVESLEELRMLSNFQIGGRSTLQILLLGQPEFREKIQAPMLEQLRQRVIATHHLLPMQADEIGPYIRHRMALVGWTGNPEISEAAAAAVHQHSGGIPRKVNMLVNRALLLGSVEKASIIDADIINSVVADLEAEVPQIIREPMHFASESTAFGMAARVAMLEVQFAEQDAALRRVLSILINWVEEDRQTGATAAHSARL